MAQTEKTTEPTPPLLLTKTKALIKTLWEFILAHLRLITASLFIFFIALIALLAFILKDIPNPQKLTRSPSPVSTQILDRRGRLLYELYQDQNRTPITIDQIPKSVKQATIAIEDKNFYSHHGLDLIGITRAAFKTLSGQRLEGGSTITQQLVKIALLEDPSRTAQRKIREAVLALVTEFIYTKDQILELYLNHIPYGGTTYGIESASREFFNKPAKDLTLAESALLAGLPQAPSKYSPFGSNPELAKQRQKQVLKRMQEEGFISEAEYDAAVKAELKFAANIVSIKAPHFVFWVKDLLIEKYGADTVNTGGLRVTTSLDLDLQEAAQASLTAQVAKIKRLKVSNGAALITKPKTGEVLSMIGSTNYFDLKNDGNVNVTLRYRQPGSSIKPLNYATGLLLGWTPSTMYLDTPTCFNVAGQKSYCPKNYDGTYHGPVHMRFALGNSYNIPAVKQLAMNGIDSFIATASAMGIQGWQEDPGRFGLSLTLGGGEVRMIDLATAFGVFANGGVRVPLKPILKVETYKGELLESYDISQVADYSSSQKLDWDNFWRQPSPLPTASSKPTPTPTPQLNFLSLFKSTPAPSPSPQPKPTDIRNEIKTVLPEEVAYIITHMLLDNNARVGAFGTQNSLTVPKKTVAVKTGTTNDLRDNWTIGYTPDYLVSVWVGNNDNSAMSYIASGITGAAPIWNDLMRHLLKSEKDQFPIQPKGVVSRQICTITGLLPTPELPCETRNELFVDKVLPANTYPQRRQIWVRRDNKLPLLPGDNTIDLDLEEHNVVGDPFQSEFCLDCAYPQETKPDPQNPGNQIPTGKISYPTLYVDMDKFKATPPIPTTPSPTPKN